MALRDAAGGAPAARPERRALSVVLLSGNLLPQTARHQQRLAGHVLRVGRCQIDRSRRDVVRLLHASERHLSLDRLLEVTTDEAPRSRSFGLDHARVDRVHANLARAELLGSREGCAARGELRRPAGLSAEPRGLLYGLGMTPTSAGARFRAAVTDERPLQVIGCVYAYAARMAERVGFKAIYLSGGGVAAGSLGVPDLGITTLEDV